MLKLRSLTSKFCFVSGMFRVDADVTFIEDV